MSEKPKFKRTLAMAVADALYCELRRFCERIAVVGSVRRGKELVGDLELLFIPKLVDGISTDMFSPPPKISAAGREIERMVRAGMLSKRFAVTGRIAGWGPENKLSVHNQTGLPVDLFSTTADNWYVSLVIRTGGKDTNLMLTTGAQKLNRTLHAYGAGVTNRATGETIKATSEQHVFELCGVPYAEPGNRL